MADFTTEDIRQLGEALANATKSAKTAQERRQRTEEFVKTEEGIKLTKLTNTQLKDLVKNNKDLSQHQKDNIANLQRVNDRLTELGRSIRDGADATVGFGKALYRGEGTISSFTDVVSGKFGLIGDTIAGTGKLLDTNIEMFRQLSQTGANFGQSIIALRTAAGNAALPLDDFASLIASNSQTLAALAGSTTQGANFIAGLGNSLRTEAIPQLSTLGFTVDEINETLLLNLDRQRRTNTFDREATQFNIDSAISFGKQLDRLAKLTGTQRSELAKQIESAQSNERFQVFLQNSTDATRQRLDLFAGTIGSLAPQLSEGFQDLIANSGRPVTEAAIELVQNAPQLRGVIRSLISGQLTTEQALAQVRNISSESVDRFSSATVTGLVNFTRLQGGFLELRNRLVDVGAVLDEQKPATERLAIGLTQFEDASKRVGAATQSLETAALAFAGDIIGGTTGMVNSGLSGLSKVILGLPGGIAASLFGVSKLLQGGLALLKDTAPTFAAVYGGTLAANNKIGLGKMLSGAKGSFGGSFGGFKQGGAGIGAKALRVGGGIGAGIGAFSAFKNLIDNDPDNNLSSILTLLGTGAGAIFGGPLGAALGGMAGGAVGSMISGRQFGGSMQGGVPHLVGEGGPEIVTTGSNSTVTSNASLKDTFDTEALETKMTSMVNELNAANKTLTSMVNGVNTLVAVESRALKAVETSARKDRNQLGIV